MRDPETYERFEKVILVHGVREVKELAYHDYLSEELPKHEFLGEMVSAQMLYYPTVTREPYKNQGRVTDLLTSNKLTQDLGLPNIDPSQRPHHDLRQPRPEQRHAQPCSKSEASKKAPPPPPATLWWNVHSLSSNPQSH